MRSAEQDVQKGDRRLQACQYLQIRKQTSAYENMKLLRYNLPYIGLVFFVIHPSKKKHPP